MKVSYLWAEISTNMCELNMVINILWGIHRLMVWKYNILCTFHMHKIHQSMSSTIKGKKIHKEDKGGKKIRGTEDLQVQKAFGYRDNSEDNTMVAEHHIREPEDEVQKWKRRTKDWNILKKGEITSYIEHLHGWKPSVTKTMVKI